VLLPEDAGAKLDEETSDATDEDDTGADSEDAFSELEDLAPAESSAEELDKSELSLEGVSAALADEESSPQAIKPAPTRALKQKARARFLIICNIKKMTPAP
jgi:hypothetical protein